METTYLEAIRQGIWEEMERDPNVFLLGEDLGVYGGAFKVTAGMLDRFGERRVMDTPLAESAIVGAAIGASIMGLRPVAEMQFADFITCAFDQIVNFAAKCRYRWGAAIPIVVRAPSGGGNHGGPFHSQNPEAWFAHVPGLKVVTPATAYDAKGLIKSAIRDNDPVVFFEHKALYRRDQGRSARGRLHGADRQGPGLPAREGTFRSSPTGRWSTWPRKPPRRWPRRASRWRSSICGRSCRSTRRPFWRACGRPPRRFCCTRTF